MAGHTALDRGIGVRIPAPQLIYTRYKRRIRLGVRTPASHAGNRGSIPLGATQGVGIFFHPLSFNQLLIPHLQLLYYYYMG